MVVLVHSAHATDCSALRRLTAEILVYRGLLQLHLTYALMLGDPGFCELCCSLVELTTSAYSQSSVTRQWERAQAGALLQGR
ncbi:hypothetical protein DAEQUDRAFT_722894 [Daedalea quercina L-15889]|uniref:Uncharacterized protein n=1 Tax=Daedalea quercina L-15889 TaxID=1314783 RepID=A0A165SN87_9APHY|nr:hypothetical protein DAEQUDRAFT_722894 [Daedalea quercina L-15889]